MSKNLPFPGAPPTPPPPPPQPMVSVILTPQGLNLQSNVANMFTAVGMLIVGAVAMILQNKDKEQQSRIIQLS
jgi:hypothetical protein